MSVMMLALGGEGRVLLVDEATGELRWAVKPLHTPEAYAGSTVGSIEIFCRFVASVRIEDERWRLWDAAIGVRRKWCVHLPGARCDRGGAQSGTQAEKMSGSGAHCGDTRGGVLAMWTKACDRSFGPRGNFVGRAERERGTTPADGLRGNRIFNVLDDWGAAGLRDILWDLRMERADGGIAAHDTSLQT